MTFWRQKGRVLGKIPPISAKSAFIVGNGPSLKATDLDMVRGIHSFASNAVYLIFPKTNWRPDFYSCVDTAVLPDRSDEINFWIRRLKKTKFVFPEVIWAHGDQVLRKRVDTFIKPQRNVYFFKSEGLNFDDETTCFNFDRNTDIIRDSMTVTIVLMQLAVKLGVKRLFLLGCDTSYVVPKEARVLDLESERVDKRLVLEGDTDPNHFDPRYFGSGKIWHTPNQELMIRHYEIAKRVCEKQGVSIFNATRGGALEVFPRISLEDAIMKINEEKTRG